MKILADENSLFAEVVSAISALEMSETSFERTCSFGISANITIESLATELKRQSFLHGQRPNIQIGGYRDNVGNAERFAEEGLQYAVFLWFFDAIVPSCQARAGAFSDDEASSLCASFAGELRAVLKFAEKFDRVFIPKMHKTRFGSSCTSERAESDLLDRLNTIIIDETSGDNNVSVLETSDILCRLGAGMCIDERMYFLYKSPYTPKFAYHLASDIFKEIRGNRSYFKKMLILDCDNTLWRGIVGEDGLSGIKLSPEDFPGNVFWMAQQFFVSLHKRGVLLALSSKNDGHNVDEVLREHEFCVLKDEHIVIKKVNWKAKSENIKEIASELDLGLDSFVFLDDSDFECEAVRTLLPEVSVFQVPKNVSEYPAVLKKISALFPYSQAGKTEEYRHRARIKQESTKWDSRDDYLRSLETQVVIRVNEKENIARIAELTQKTNQFNLTTKRYSEKDILEFMRMGRVYSLHVSDKFGSSGLVAVCIVRDEDEISVVDTFLMSCRVIGREIEYSPWSLILNDAQKFGSKIIQARFIQTQKNNIVKNFYEELDFELLQEGGSPLEKIYKRDLAFRPQGATESKFQSRSHLFGILSSPFARAQVFSTRGEIVRGPWKTFSITSSSLP